MGFRKLVLLALFGLLFAQLGAVSHSYAHDAAPGAGSTTHRLAAASHNPCNDCLGYAPLLLAGGTPSALPVALPATIGTRAAAGSVSRAEFSPLLAFRSRAPPTR